MSKEALTKQLCPVCDTPDGDHLDWCTPQARAVSAVSSNECYEGRGGISGKRCNFYPKCVCGDRDALRPRPNALCDEIRNIARDAPMSAGTRTRLHAIAHDIEKALSGDSSAPETKTQLQRALETIDAAGALSDWINRARPVITELMAAYERRIRTDCTPEQLAKEPWRCMEYIGAEELLRDQPVAVVEIRSAQETPREPDIALHVKGPYCDEHLTDVRAWCVECMECTRERKGSVQEISKHPVCNCDAEVRKGPHLDSCSYWQSEKASAHPVEVCEKLDNRGLHCQNPPGHEGDCDGMPF